MTDRESPSSTGCAAHRQSRSTLSLFWSTVLVSALNERLEQMDVGHARKVFVDGFLSTRTGFQMELPLVPLGELYGSRLETWLHDHAVDVRLNTGVRSIDLDDDGARGVSLRSGEPLSADFVVLAVPSIAFAVCSPRPQSAGSPRSGLDLLNSSPITGVHLWFDRPICPFDHVVHLDD